VRDRTPKRAAALGYVSYSVFFLLLLRWILNLEASALPYPAIRPPLWVLASGYLAIYGALFGLITVGLARLWRHSPLLFAPPVWVALEYLRGRGDLGFTWGQVPYALARYPFAIQSVSLGGIGLLSLTILTGATLLVASCTGRRPKWLIVAAALAIVALGHGLIRPNRSVSGRTLTVSAVQPNISAGDKWYVSRLAYNLAVLEKLSLQAALAEPDLIVWPETAALVDLTVDSGPSRQVHNVARKAETHLLAGFPRLHDGSARNSAALISPDGERLELYDKIHPVPFSERMPLGPVFSWVRRFNLGQSDFAAGERSTVFRLPSGRFGALICFESTFAELARELVRNGAEFLVVITNDAWFGRGAGSAEQHADMAVLRAVEVGAPVVRCANTGISMIIGARGSVVDKVPPWQEAVLTVDLQLGRGSTLYLKWGDWVAYLCLALTGCLLVVGAAHRALNPSAPGEAGDRDHSVSST
jgi:apolipoprotein N-acyltransferase